MARCACLLASLLLLPLVVLLHAVAGAVNAQTSHVVVPDLAGMLYPTQQQYKLVDFGTSPSANLFESINEMSPEDAGATPGATASSTLCAANLCVDLVFTSVFEVDPFLLTRYESRYPVVSPLSDGQALEANAIQPVITGSPSSDNNGTNAQVQTWWRFSTNSSDLNQVPTVDLLLRLKQQSQFKSAKKDQLLVHFVAKRKSEFSVTTTIESYSVYGNARISHETTRVDSRRVQIAFTIQRKATQRDVTINDAYPFAVKYEISASPNGVDTGNRWRYEQPKCAQCVALLYNCSTLDDLQSGLCDYDSTSAPLVKCLRDTHELTSAAFKSVLELHNVGFETPLESILSSCFDALIEAEDAESLTSHGTPASTPLHARNWWNSTSAMSCLAQHSCPFGPLNSVYLQDASATTMVTLTNTTEFTHRVRITAAAFLGYFEISFGASSSSWSAGNSPARVQTRALTQDSSESEVAAALQDAIAIPDLLISVKKTFSGIWTLEIVISNLLFPNVVPQLKLDSVADDFDETHAMTAFSMLKVTPFNATQLTLEDKCDVCIHHLDACQQSEQCRESVLPCLITQFATVVPQQQDRVMYVPEFGKSRFDVLNSFTECTSYLSVATWNSVRKAFLCVAKQSCAVGSEPVSKSPTVFKVENGTQVFVVPLDADTGSVALEFSRVIVGGTSQATQPQQTYKFQSSVSSLPLFIRAFVLQNGADITQTSRVDPADPSRVEITLQYANLLGALPYIEAAGGITWIENTPAMVYFEYLDENEEDNENALPVLTTLLDTLQAKALPLSSVGAPLIHSWAVSSDCASCSAKLYTCTPADVLSRTCHYNSMMSPFGRCLRQQLPSSVFQRLLNTTTIASLTVNTPSLEVRNVVAYCANVISSTAASGASGASRTSVIVALNVALGCFTATKCPFGPLELVESSHVVLLDTTSYIHVVRVHDRMFEITLQFRFTDVESFAQVTFTQTTSRSEVLGLLTASLTTSGIVPSVLTYEREAEGAEWTMEFRYDSAVLPGFSVSIAPNSLPAKSAIEQIRMKASLRLSVVARNPLKLFQQATDGPGTTTGGFNYSNFASAGYSSCPECPDSYLETCRQSLHCHTTVLPCFIQRLESFGTPTESAMELDVTTWLQSCAATPSSGVSYYNWWAPLQRFLTCYARSQCKVSRSWTALATASSATGDLSSTVLRVQQGEETLFVPVSDVSLRIFSLDVFPPAQGTNFASQEKFEFMGNSSRLELLLAYLTMDTASNVTVTLATEPNSGTGLTQVRIWYGDDYVGALPLIVPRDNGVSNGPSQPRLVLASTPAGLHFPLDWSGLLETLRASSSLSFSGSSCRECEEEFLRVCRSYDGCSTVVLECARAKFTRNAMIDADMQLFGLDRDILTDLLACANGVQLMQSSPFQSFIVCYEQTQCRTNEPTSPTPSYLRLQRGKIRFSLSSPVDSFFATIDVPETGSGPVSLPFYGSLDSLQALLETITEHTASVGIQSWQPEKFTSDTFQVQITYDGYYGVIPNISITSNAQVDGAAIHVQPQMILFSASGHSPNADTLVDTIAAYSARPECNTVCSEHLNACDNGNSRASLVCREFSMLCFNMMLDGLAPHNTPSDFAVELRSCASLAMLAAAIPLEDFVLCYEKSKCPLNRQGMPTSLQIKDGSETVRVPIDRSVTMMISPPSDATESAVVDEFEFTGDLYALETYLQVTILESRAHVQVETLSMNNEYRVFVITYKNYLGELPVFSGQDVESLKRTPPQVLTNSKSVGEIQTWDRFQARLQDRLQVVFNKRLNCDSCASDHLTNCPACPVVLPCLVQKLQPPISSEVTPTSESPTGTDFTSALWSCVSGHTVSEWRGLGSFFSCLEANSCPISDVNLGYNEQNSTFVVLHDGFNSFEVENSQLPAALTVTSALDSTGSADSVLLDVSDGFLQFKMYLKTLLGNAGAGDNLVTVADSLAFRDGVLLRNFTLNYRDYYGLLPAVSGTGVTVLSVQDPQYSFQSLNGLAQWGHLFELLAPFLDETPTPSPAPAIVLKNTCRACGSALFGCEALAIADGSCSYENPTSMFAICLSRSLNASAYERVLSPDGVDGVAINSQLSDCYRGIDPTDESADAASFTGDLWYATSEALACFDSNACPLGPLQVSTTSDSRMVHLESVRTRRMYSIDGETFSAVFTAKYGFRTLTSSAFTESSDNAALNAIIVEILPARAVVVSSIATRSDNLGFDVTLDISLLYFPDLEIKILVDGTTSVTGDVQEPWVTKLIAGSLDTETIETLP